MNAMNGALIEALWRRAQELAVDPNIRVVLITGAGDKAFSAGADLKARHTMTYEERRAFSHAVSRAVNAVEALPMPVIAAINGYCLAGGLELALACDIRIAAEHATFGLPEIRLGGFPGAGGAVRLPRLITKGRAKELLFTGKRISAREAERIGLVERVVPFGELMDEAMDLAEQLASLSPQALRSVKRVVDATADGDLSAALAFSQAYRDPLQGTKDQDEGIAAFVEKREPTFKGQ